MRKILLSFFVLSTAFVSAQSAFQFTTFGTGGELGPDGHYAATTLDLPAFRQQLRAKSTLIELPVPEGGTALYTVEDDPVFEAALAKKYPGIGSYRVTGDWGTGRIAISHKGVDALLVGPNGTYAIQPGDAGTEHLVYYSREYAPGGLMATDCGYDPTDPLNLAGLEVDRHLGGDAGANILEKTVGEPRELRQYDLIMSNTGEFASLINAESKADVLAAFNVAVSTLNAIFEREIGIRMQLLELSETVIYLDAASDPYIDSDEGSGLLDQVIEAFRAAEIPSSVYDLGHVFTSRCIDVGGVVSGRACSGSKTRGVTCLQGGNVARTAERVLAHEIAHQFSVSHSWNNCPSNQGQRAGQTAFEPGSGTTIMSYAGACGDQNIGGEEAYYHTGSLEQFLFFTREGGAADCATVIETGNVSPEVTIDHEDGFFIPFSTPFRLSGSATDDNDPAERLTYTWEQYDLGPAVDIEDPSGTAPTFRSVRPSDAGNVRYFPRLDRVANNISSDDEVLPDYARDMTFRLTARDNNGEAGGVDWATLNFAVADVGPFVVNEPVTDDDDDDGPWRSGDYREVTWEVNGTNGAPVFTDRVNILLSGDGGLTFDYVLASEVANNGSAFVTVPDTVGEAMRIVIEATDNIYYNMNATDFSIAAATTAGYTLESDVRYDNVCLPETVVATFTAGSVLGFSAPLTLSLDPGATLPEGIDVRFESTEVLPGQSTSLTLDLDGVTTSGRFTVPVIVATPGFEDSRREIVLDVVANDFSDLMLAGPAEGTGGIVLTTDFDWTEAANAQFYEYQLATSPSFAPVTVLAEEDDLLATEYTPEVFLTANTVYFWRVRPINSCGPGPWTETASFRTVSSQCDVYASTDTPVNLPGSGGAFTKESKLFVDRRGTINDLNLPSVVISYQFVSKVTVSLTSPAGTTVELYGEKCFSTNRLDLGFDDDAPDEVACPPDDKQVFQPSGELSDFDGEDTFGEWILTVAVSEVNGAAGQIVSWDVEFCADLVAAQPQTIVNEPTEVRPLGRNAVLQTELEINSNDEEAGVTYFTITRLPARGTLERSGAILMTGDTFTQADINERRVVYESTDTSELTDDFGFVVTSPGGGYLPVTYHDILITDDAITSTRTVSVVEASLHVFPNPVADRLQVRWSAPGNRTIDLELYDVNGRQLLRQQTGLSAGSAELPVAGLPAGLYLLRVDGAVRRVVKR